MQSIWEEFLKIIKEEAGSQVVETWFKAVCLERWDNNNNTVYLKVPNQFVKKWIQEHYTNLIKIHISRLLNTNEINIVFNSTLQNTNPQRNFLPASSLTKETPGPQPTNNTSIVIRQNAQPILNANAKKLDNLNEDYNFNSFVIGPSNSLAHAAAWAICQNLGKVYNPLFIYGGTGLGKTHLLHAIGNEIKNKMPETIIRYETSDRFINEFITSIRLDKVHFFRKKYQEVDLLMIDDIQFLSNKEQTQEAFFHIFNSLYDEKKQIILSSDTFPKEIKGIQQRLQSRLEWGLVVDIQMPDLETKIAILKKKAELNSINLNDDVAEFIASRITSNIRELEGALIRVGAFSALTNQPTTLNLAQRVLLNLGEKKKDGIMLENVLKIVAKNYCISVLDLKSKKRHKSISVVRQVTFYMMKKLTFYSLQIIGDYVGKRDHSTVLHAIAKVENIMRTDPHFTKKLKSIEQEILRS